MRGEMISLASCALVLILAGGALAADDASVVIHYSFDDVGQTVADQSGNAHHGTVQGGVRADPAGVHNGAKRVARCPEAPSFAGNGGCSCAHHAPRAIGSRCE